MFSLQISNDLSVSVRSVVISIRCDHVCNVKDKWNPGRKGLRVTLREDWAGLLQPLGYRGEKKKKKKKSLAYLTMIISHYNK